MVARQWKIILICLGLLLAAILLLTRKSEPTYHGRTLDEWIDDYARAPMSSPGFAENREFFFNALHKAGTNALPYLVRNLARNDSAWHKKYCEWQPTLPEFLKRFAPPPKPLLQPWNGTLLFVDLGSNSLPHLVPLLKHKSTAVRQSVAMAIAPQVHFRFPGFKQAIPFLIDALDDPNPDVRAAAVLAFTEMGPEGSNAVPALTKILRYAGTNSLFWFGMRSQAAFALGNVGPPARDALPELKRALGESSSLAANLRGNAAVAIWRIDKDIDTTLPVLVHEIPVALGDRNTPDWIEALGEMGPRGKKAFDQLRDELKTSPNVLPAQRTND